MNTISAGAGYVGMLLWCAWVYLLIGYVGGGLLYLSCWAVWHPLLLWEKHRVATCVPFVICGGLVFFYVVGVLARHRKKRECKYSAYNTL